MIKSFNKNEKMALIAILKFIINSDGMITDDEIAVFNEIAEQKGFEDFKEIFKEVYKKIHSLNDFKNIIDSVKDETHRNDILKYVIEIALANITINPQEAQILRMIGKEWKININSLLNAS